MPTDDELIDRILDHSASAQERADFQLWLQVPANLERFARRAELCADLRRTLRRQHIQHSALQASHTEPHVARDFQTPGAAHSPGVRWMPAVVALVATACVVAAVVWQQGGRDELSGPVAASVVSDVNGRLTKHGILWDQTQLPAGDYVLQEGLLNLKFGGGVMVYVEAPARFDAVSDDRLVLHSGRVSATVPPEGIGFTVETPEAEVVDFGTEFSVDVEGGTSEVHVFDGLVRVHPGTSKRREAANSVDLQASQAVRITDGTAEPVDISLAKDRFIRNFDEPKWIYARQVKRLLPLASYRMPIRDRGLVSDPPEHSGTVLIGEGRRPPHARGVFVGGSLRVGADSTGRGGLVTSPPALLSTQFSLTAFVYLEARRNSAVVVTNLRDRLGSFGLSLTADGMLQATVRNRRGARRSVTGDSVLPLNTWRHVVLTADGERLRLYEDGRLAASTPCAAMADSESDVIWFGTDADRQQLWNGRIDEVALFDRPLSEQDVAALYRAAQQEIARSP